MFRRIGASSQALGTALLVAMAPAQAAPDPCGFARAFDQPDENGSQTVHVYQGSSSAGIGGARPFAFVVADVKVNTDGTRISYNADDPRAQTKAINDIRNAYRNPSHPIQDFEKIRDAGWQPTSKVWDVLSSAIIEKDKRPGKEGLPCLDEKNYLVSMTAIRATASGTPGDCDQSKWIDALTVPAFVLPGASKFQPGGASVGNVVIALSLGERRMALGIVGDTGPAKEIGEASVEMNRILNGLPAGSIPTNRVDAEKRFQGPKTILLVLPGASNRISQPINASTVNAFAEARFNAWGGRERLEACLSEIPEAR
jgi:Fungal chitosanase of glycosyl hydrolase group 75